MLVKNIPHTFYFLKLVTKVLLCSLVLTPLTASEFEPELVLSKLSLREKIAQLFMVSVTTEQEHSNVQETLHLIDHTPIGGVIFFKGTIDLQRKALDQLQAKSTLPLLVGQDNEWGASLRLKDALRFPRNLTLGALSNPKLIYDLGLEIGLQCRGVGVHVNFAPVVDINNNASNPVINDRSFGESIEEVTSRSLLMMKGMHDANIIACAKHFPGHGDTHEDSHHVLPVLNKSLDQLKNCELKPFQALIDQGLLAIMPAHLSFPLICDSYPTTLSSDFLQTLLKEDLGFNGLVFTDSLEMKAINGPMPKGEAEYLALKAGNDILVSSPHLSEALDRIERAVNSGDLSIKELNEKVLKILKYKAKLIESNVLNYDSSLNLFSKEALRLKKELFEQALTLVHDHPNISFNSNKKTAFVQIGRDLIMKDSLKLSKLSSLEQKPASPPPFYQELSKSCSCDYFFLPKKATTEEVHLLLEKLKSYPQIVIGIYEMNKFERLYHGICPSTLEFITSLDPSSLWLNLFGSPYSLKYFEVPAYILMAYENDPNAQHGAADILLGKKKAKGQLPITASSNYPLGSHYYESQEEFEF